MAGSDNNPKGSYVIGTGVGGSVGPVSAVSFLTNFPASTMSSCTPVCGTLVSSHSQKKADGLLLILHLPVSS